MEPSLNHHITSNFSNLEKVARNFDQGSLNDGEAGHIQTLINDCLKGIHTQVESVSVLPKEYYVSLQEGFSQVDNQFKAIFSEKNEQMFSPLRQAHESYSALKREVNVKFHHPNFMLYLKAIDHLLDSAKELYDFDSIQTTMEWIHTKLNDIDTYVRQHHKMIDSDEALWINHRLDTIVKRVDKMDVRRSPDKETEIMIEIEATIDKIQDMLVESGFEVTQSDE